MEQDDDLLISNGIEAETGRSSLAPMTSSELVRAILRQPDPTNLPDLRLRRSQDAQSLESVTRLQALLDETERQLRTLPLAGSDAATVAALTESLRRMEQAMRQRQHLGVRAGIDAAELSQSGWGVILAEDAEPQLLEALQPLLALRREQAGERFRVYAGARGYRTGARDSKSKFLVRSGATAAGPVSPEAVPYYLLIVGGPDKIPFEFQHQLDVQYAVGRIHFDTLAEYGQYARTVVAAEAAPPSRPQRLTFFDVQNPGDRATQLSSNRLVAPLHDLFRQSEPGWDVCKVPPAEAGRERLRRLLHAEAPALLFTASHGMELAPGAADQQAHQGALLCQDWPGESHIGPICREHFFSAADIDDSAQLFGMVLFLFACYSAGTPERDSFQRDAQAAPRAPRPFLAALPKRLLGHPAGGALAVIGHVDRAWGYSFTGSGGTARAHTAAIESTLRRILRGERVGHAMEYLNQRYAELATVLSDELGAVRNMRQPDERALAELWTATHDARGYCLLGDPAVRLAVPPPARKTEERPCGA